MQISVINCFSSSNIFSCFFTSFSRPWNQIIEYFTEWIMMITLWRMYWLMDQKLIMPSLSLKSVCCTELIKQDLIWHANPAVYDLAWKQKQDKHYDLSCDYCLELNQPASLVRARRHVPPSQMFSPSLHCRPLQLLTLSWTPPFSKFNRPKWLLLSHGCP